VPQPVPRGETVVTPPLDELIAWQREGTAALEAAVAGLTDDAFGEPSALPGWRRAHVVAHLARNADALLNLLDWAATGVPIPMYTDAGQRARDIETGAALPPAELRDDLLAADKRLADAVATQPEAAWRARVRSALGRDIPASEVPWLRVREVWVHLVDLHCGPTLAGLPDGLVAALLADATAALTRRPDAPAVALTSGTAGWTIGQRPALTVTCPPAALLGWVIGRSDGAELDTGGAPLPTLPPWL
jgi:maleylpyruvate isomerase